MKAPNHWEPTQEPADLGMYVWCLPYDYGGGECWLRQRIYLAPQQVAHFKLGNHKTTAGHQDGEKGVGAGDGSCVHLIVLLNSKIDALRWESWWHDLQRTQQIKSSAW